MCVVDVFVLAWFGVGGWGVFDEHVTIFHGKTSMSALINRNVED